jgi:hypothetical protein
LTEIYVNAARTVCTDSGEKIITMEANKRVLHSATIASKKDCTRSWTIPNAKHITFLERRSKRRRCEREVVGLVTIGMIGDGIPIVARHSEWRIRLSC